MKHSHLDIPLGPARRRALDIVADRWTMWLLLAVDELEGSRFADFDGEPGLSRRVLADRLRLLVGEALLRTEQYCAHPPRHRYLLTERGAQVRRLALATVHVAAGGALTEDPLLARAPEHGNKTAKEAPSGATDQHPADALLEGDLDAAARIHAETVAVLARYDLQYRTSLVDTVATWLACDASVSVAAARLFAHRHTIRYRLDRVRELTGLDLASTAGRERIALGLRARAVLEAAGRLDRG